MAEEADQLQLTRVARLLRETRLTSDQSTELTELISNMASQNITARLEAKMDAQNAQIDAMGTKYTVLIWTIGFAGLIISAAIIFGDKIN